MNAVYVHIPFCKHICSYCDFSKVLYIDAFVDEYLQALQKEILDNYDGERISTIYVGGGTPSCLSKQERIKLFRILEIFNKTPDCEFTFECNPSDIDDDLLDDLAFGGVNRVSIGIESFEPSTLEVLEREIDYDDIESKLNKLRIRGITNINLDLMYAIPGQKISSLKKDINKIIKLKPTHISTYSLIIEDNTKMKINGLEYIDTDTDAKMYETICKKLKKEGYIHYEVSNFSKPGFESKHNLNYWNNDEYYGFGLGASGYKDAFRYTNTKNLHEYIDGNYKFETNLMTYKDQTDNELMLGLRKLKGINLADFYNKYNKRIEELYDIKPLMDSGDLIFKDNYLYINPDKIYIMNEILIKIIDI